jgi:hypothetical protein
VGVVVWLEKMCLQHFVTDVGDVIGEMWEGSRFEYILSC